MRLLGILLNLFFFISAAQGQELTEKKWIKFHAERADGSRIIARQSINDAYFEYYFSKDGEVTISSSLGIYNLPYEINDSIICINNNLTYKIEKLQEALLVLVEIPKVKTEIDKTNRVYFTLEGHYFENVFNLSLVTFKNDSTIITNKYMKPKFTQSHLNEYFKNEFNNLNLDSLYLKGSFVLSPRRDILNVEIDSTTTLLSDNLEKIKNIFRSTIYKWEPPIHNLKYYYFVNYKVIIRNGAVVELTFFDNTYDKQYKNLTLGEKNSALIYYNRANVNFKRKRYEKAISYYTKCLMIDSIFLDAVYNRAKAYKALNRISEACDDWKYLYELGQVKGANLYKCNCKK